MTDASATHTSDVQQQLAEQQKRAAQQHRMRVIARAAAQARYNSREGYSTDDYRDELARSKRSRALARVLVTLCVILALLAAAAVILLQVFSVERCYSDDMAPAICNGQLVASEKNASLERGDAFSYRDGATIKFSRVVAEPGSWVNIMSDGTLVISAEQMQVEEPEGSVQFSQSNQTPGEQTSQTQNAQQGQTQNAQQGQTQNAQQGQTQNVQQGQAQNAQSGQTQSPQAQSAGSSDTLTVKMSCQVPEGSYYALGDSENPTVEGLRGGSDFISSDKVIGKAVLRVWPLADFGAVL